MLLSLRVSLWLVAVSRPVESHSRARGNILAGPLWGESFGIFFEMAHSGVLNIFEQQQGPQTSWGPG